MHRRGGRNRARGPISQAPRARGLRVAKGIDAPEALPSKVPVPEDASPDVRTLVLGSPAPASQSSAASPSPPSALPSSPALPSQSALASPSSLASPPMPAAPSALARAPTSSQRHLDVYGGDDDGVLVDACTVGTARDLDEVCVFQGSLRLSPRRKEEECYEESDENESDEADEVDDGNGHLTKDDITAGLVPFRSVSVQPSLFGFCEDPNRSLDRQASPAGEKGLCEEMHGMDEGQSVIDEMESMIGTIAANADSDFSAMPATPRMGLDNPMVS